ncbi:MAG: hypothetical protein JWL76_1893, partial [Thermoleophilia bacterium]|nr:hypothetical protein [Thermoleophilia bacterium]
AAPPVPPAPVEAVKSPEYDAVDYLGTGADIVGGTAAEMVSPYVAPHIEKAVNDFLNAENFPVLGSKYGAVIPGKVAGTIVGQFNGMVSTIIADAIKGSKGEPGLGWKPTPPNKLIAGTTKGIVTTWMKMALTEALKPPPPPPAPVYPPDVVPLPAPPAPTPPPPKKILLTDSAQIKGAITSGLIGMGVSAIYDQTVGPLVQRAANLVTGRSGEEIKPPAPLTPGRVVNGLVDSVLSSMLVRNVAYAPLPGSPPPAPGAGTPFAGALSASLLNGIIGAAWSTVYGRGLGTSIENGVNQLAGIRTKEEVAKSPLPAMEHFTRAATRGVAVGATTYLLGNALNASMVRLGASIGGVGGAIVAMAGAALIGSIGGTIVDATVGPMLGKLGGQIYSWITGKPTYEQRMEEAAKAPAPGPTPGDPVKAPNGNPGTVPSPAPAAPAPVAPAAPAAGAPKRRRKTGVRAVDATSPAINVRPGRLAAIAARG